jgi:CPSF A subunit region
MLADCHHSVQFLRYIEEGKQLKLLGRDYGKLAVRCGSFCSAAGALHMIVGDGGGSVHGFVYDPKDLASGQGNRLIPWYVYLIMYLSNGLLF